MQRIFGVDPFIIVQCKHLRLVLETLVPLVVDLVIIVAYAPLRNLPQSPAEKEHHTLFIHILACRLESARLIRWFRQILHCRKYYCAVAGVLYALITGQKKLYIQIFLQKILHCQQSSAVVFECINISVGCIISVKKKIVSAPEDPEFAGQIFSGGQIYEPRSNRFRRKPHIKSCRSRLLPIDLRRGRVYFSKMSAQLTGSGFFNTGSLLRRNNTDILDLNTLCSRHSTAAQPYRRATTQKLFHVLFPLFYLFCRLRRTD